MAGIGTQNRRPNSPMRNFGATPPIQTPRSVFKLDKTWTGTFDSGLLIPFYVSEVLPADSRKVRISAMVRMLSPLKRPIFDNLYIDFHFWNVPYRQVWPNFVKMMGEQDQPTDSIDFLVPQTTIATGTQDLHDPMGLPPRDAAHVSNNYEVSALPQRSYARIYNFHYRDQNLIASVPQATGDGPDGIADTNPNLLKRGKRHDYLTASLPFQQKGDPVNLPLGLQAPVIANPADPIPEVRANTGETADRQFTVDAGDNVSLVTTAGTGTLSWAPGFKGATTNSQAGLIADLTQATAASITDLRQAIAVQHVLERDARSGTRYPEILMSRYRVMDPQMLVLQRPEFLGGGTQRITLTPIPQTGETGTTDQGNLTAVGTATVDGIGFTRSFTEFGLNMGIMSVRADLRYQQGVERFWSKRARFDFYHPELAHLSEQAVLNKEIYVDGTAEDENTWGFIGPYDEYRYGQSLITGRLRSSHAQTLDVWHLSQYFASRPTLNQTFIEESPPVDRVIAVTDEPQFAADIYISDTAARGMPISGIPGLSRI